MRRSNYTSVFIICGPLLGLLIAVNFVIEDKSLKLLGVLRLMGLYESAYWGAYLAWFSIPSFIGAVLVWLYGRFVTELWLFQRVPGGIWILALSAFYLAILSIGLVVAAVASKPVWGNSIAFPFLLVTLVRSLVNSFIAFFLSILLPTDEQIKESGGTVGETQYGTYMEGRFRPSRNRIIRALAYLLPTLHMSKIFYDIADVVEPHPLFDANAVNSTIAAARDYTWDDLTAQQEVIVCPFGREGCDVFTPPATLTSIIWLFCDALIYFVMAWYLSQVLGGQNGAKQPVYFPFLPAYWGIKVFNKSGGQSAEAADRVAVERETSGKEGSIRIFKLSKRFKETSALSEVTFDMSAGSIVAVLGKNGAGKSTLLNVLTGVHDPTHGDVFFRGLSVKTDMPEIRDRIGVCPQEDLLWMNLGANFHLRLAGLMKGRYGKELRDEVNRMLAHVHLTEDAFRPVGGFSGGMKRRLGVARAALFQPKLIFLDEPSAGVDALSRRRLWDMILPMREHSTVLLTTHSMDEADVLGNKVVIMSRGKIRAEGSPLFLKERFGAGKSLHVLCDEARSAQAEAFVRAVVPLMDVQDRSAGSLTIGLPADMRVGGVPMVLARLEESVKSGAGLIKEFGLSNATLTSVFLRLVQGDEVNASTGGGGGGGEGGHVSALCAICTENTPLVCGECIVRGRELPEIMRSTIEEGMAAPKSPTDIVPLLAGAPEEPLMKELGIEHADVTEAEAAAAAGDGKSSLIPNLEVPKEHVNPVDQVMAIIRAKLAMRVAHRVFHAFQVIFIVAIVAAAYLIQVQILGLVGGGGGGLAGVGAPPGDPMCSYPFDDGFGGIDSGEPEKCTRLRFRSNQLNGRLPLYGNGTDPATGDVVPRWDYFAAMWQSAEGYESRISSPGEFFWYTLGPNAANGVPAIQTVSVYNDTSGQYQQIPEARDPGATTLKELMNARGTSWSDAAAPSLSEADAKAYVNENWPKFHIIVNEDASAMEMDVELKLWVLQAEEIMRDKYGETGGKISEDEFDRFSVNAAWPRTESPWFGYDDYFYGAYSRYDETALYGQLMNAAVFSPALARVSGGDEQVFTSYQLFMPTNTETNIDSQTYQFVLYFMSTMFLLALMLIFPALIADAVRDVKPLAGQMLPMGMRQVRYWVGLYSSLFIICFASSAVFYAVAAVFKVPVVYKLGENFGDEGTEQWQKSVVGIGLFSTLLLAFAHALVGMAICIATFISSPRAAFMGGYVSLLLAVMGAPLVYLTVPDPPKSLTVFPPWGMFDALIELGSPAPIRYADIFFPHITWMVVVGSAALAIGVYHSTLERQNKGWFFFVPAVWGWGKAKWTKQARGQASNDASTDAEANANANAVELQTKADQAISVGTEVIAASHDGLMVSISESPIGDPQTAEHARAVLQDVDSLIYSVRMCGVTKIWGASHVAVNNVTWGVRRGETLALLGVNGAGKTTQIQCLSSQTPLSFGRITIQGQDVVETGGQGIGLTPQFDSLYADLTVRQHLLMYARLKGVPSKRRRALVYKIADLVDLSGDAFDQKASQLSGGMARRLTLGCSLCGDSPFIVLDEPTSALDVASRLAMWRIISRLKSTGRAILLTTHSLEEADALAQNIVIMSRGRVVAVGSPQELKQRYAQSYRLDCMFVAGQSAEVQAKRAERLTAFVAEHIPTAELTSTYGLLYTFRFPTAAVSVSDVYRTFEEHSASLGLSGFSTAQSSLEDVFLTVADSAEKEEQKSGN